MEGKRIDKPCEVHATAFIFMDQVDGDKLRERMQAGTGAIEVLKEILESGRAKVIKPNAR